MKEQGLTEINWTAVFVGFIVDWAVSLPVGLVVSVILLSWVGTSLDSQQWPPEVVLAGQIVGIGGAIIGGGTAGFIARQHGTLHGTLAAVFSLFASLCWFGAELDLGDLGFVILNLVGAGYGGKVGARWGVRRQGGS
jgi:hypothetical protein